MKLTNPILETDLAVTGEVDIQIIFAPLLINTQNPQSPIYRTASIIASFYHATVLLHRTMGRRSFLF